jgi:hypothetical protein
MMVMTDMHATIEKLLKGVFSVQSAPRLYDKDHQYDGVERESAGSQSVEGCSSCLATATASYLLPSSLSGQ